MAIKVTCELCGKTLSASDDKAGKRGKCPGCGALIVVPALKENIHTPNVFKSNCLKANSVNEKTLWMAGLVFMFIGFGIVGSFYFFQKKESMENASTKLISQERIEPTQTHIINSLEDMVPYLMASPKINMSMIRGNIGDYINKDSKEIYDFLGYNPYNMGKNEFEWHEKEPLKIKAWKKVLNTKYIINLDPLPSNQALLGAGGNDSEKDEIIIFKWAMGYKVYDFNLKEYSFSVLFFLHQLKVGNIVTYIADNKALVAQDIKYPVEPKIAEQILKEYEKKTLKLELSFKFLDSIKEEENSNSYRDGRVRLSHWIGHCPIEPLKIMFYRYDGSNKKIIYSYDFSIK
jgi:DNA-directed RNA polymerase subunit RPC12/RpoP